MDDRPRSLKGWIVDTFEPLRPAYDAWMRAISGFNWILVRIILTVTFFTAFLAYGAILRLVGKDPMKRTLDDDRPSYWADNARTNTSLSDFERQY